ncbi:hypothetical protein [Herbiconiux ginsengi]|uniref:Uncharacterized protein n=1 Tax=Herbiconiux ginsengi TaxID=381665 RepID=A0A1H3SPK1_9MICO|nr:hypothetical protein [Herbiconiux ginsengi]SDZ39854.1 hypothetical protein SAMN05216554_3556 [Herbiconiux ginsengi]
MIGFLAWRGIPQRLDPIVARSIYPLIGVAAIGSMIYAIVRTLTAGAEVRDPFFAGVAIAFVVVAAVLVMLVTDPVRSPARFGGLAGAVAAAVLASVASSVSTWGTSNVIWDNWGPLVVGIVILTFSEFRPGRDLALVTAVSAVIVGSTAALETSAMPDLASPVTSAVIAATPVVLFGVGASVFSYRLSLLLSRSAESALREQSGLSRRVRIRLRELLRESGREALSVDVVPFLEGVLERGEVTEADAARARRISAVLRSVIITDMALPWLQRLARAHPDALQADDPGDLAERLTMEQKVALRAVVTTLVAVRTRSASPVVVRLREVGRHRSILLLAPYDGGETGVRVRFGSSIAVMNAVFGRSTVSVVEGELRMLFAFEPKTVPAPASGPASGPQSSMPS